MLRPLHFVWPKHIYVIACHCIIPSIMIDLDFGTGCTLSLVSVWLKSVSHSISVSSGHNDISLYP
jgi:hypothetical protein